MGCAAGRIRQRRMTKAEREFLSTFAGIAHKLLDGRDAQEKQRQWQTGIMDGNNSAELHITASI